MLFICIWSSPVGVSAARGISSGGLAMTELVGVELDLRAGTVSVSGERPLGSSASSVAGGSSSREDPNQVRRREAVVEVGVTGMLIDVGARRKSETSCGSP